jgi:hypothetical protein
MRISRNIQDIRLISRVNDTVDQRDPKLGLPLPILKIPCLLGDILKPESPSVPIKPIFPLQLAKKSM